MRTTFLLAAIFFMNAAAQEPGSALSKLDKELLESAASAQACEKPFSVFGGDEKSAASPAIAQVRTIGELIDSGARIDAAFPDGTTALMIAVQNSVECVVDTLCSRGANAALQDQKGMTALMYACIAAKESNKIIYKLLARTPNANQQDNNGATALILAAKNGKTEAVNILLNFGGDVDMKTKAGATALSTAEYHKHKEIVKILKKRGASH